MQKRLSISEKWAAPDGPTVRCFLPAEYVLPTSLHLRGVFISPRRAGEMEIPESVSSINDLIDRLHIEHRERINGLKEQLNGEIRDVLARTTDDQSRNRLASDIYWEIKNANANEIKRLAGAKILKRGIKRTCLVCEADYTEYPTSKTDAKERGTKVCGKCHRERAERHWRAYAEKVQNAAALVNWLKSLPYHQYLDTEHWRAMRSAALNRSKFKCQLCKSEGHLNVHHNNYDRLGEEEHHDLVVLCRECHATFHGKLP